METTTWFLASAIAAGAGVAAGVTVGPWGAWIGGVLAGAAVTAASRRLSGVAGAAVVAGSVGALIVTRTLAAVLLAIASVALIAGIAAVYLFLLRILLVRGQTAVSPPDVESSGISPGARNLTRSAAPARPASIELLEPWQVEYLVRLATRDRDEFARQLSALRPRQRAQVERAVQGIIGDANTRTDADAPNHHAR